MAAAAAQSTGQRRHHDTYIVVAEVYESPPRVLDIWPVCEDQSPSAMLHEAAQIHFAQVSTLHPSLAFRLEASVPDERTDIVQRGWLFDSDRARRSVSVVRVASGHDAQEQRRAFAGAEEVKQPPLPQHRVCTCACESRFALRGAQFYPGRNMPPAPPLPVHIAAASSAAAAAPSSAQNMAKNMADVMEQLKIKLRERRTKLVLKTTSRNATVECTAGNASGKTSRMNVSEETATKKHKNKKKKQKKKKKKRTKHGKKFRADSVSSVSSTTSASSSASFTSTTTSDDDDDNDNHRGKTGAKRLPLPVLLRRGRTLFQTNHGNADENNKPVFHGAEKNVDGGDTEPDTDEEEVLQAVPSPGRRTPPVGHQHQQPVPLGTVERAPLSPVAEEPAGGATASSSRPLPPSPLVLRDGRSRSSQSAPPVQQDLSNSSSLIQNPCASSSSSSISTTYFVVESCDSDTTEASADGSGQEDNGDELRTAVLP